MNERCDHCGQLVQGDIITNGAIRVDTSRREVFIGPDEIDFTRREYDLFAFFVKNKGRVLTFRHIMENVWGRGYLDQTHYLRVFLTEVRKKLAIYKAMDNLIVAKRGIGYEMVDLNAVNSLAA